MIEQLRLEGDPIFEPTLPSKLFAAIFKQHFEEPLREQLRSTSPLLFLEPDYEQLALFKRAPSCPHRIEFDDDNWLVCHLELHHAGNHFDKWSHVEWLQH